MIIEGDDGVSHVKMLNNPTQSRLWFVHCSVMSGCRYHYGAKVSSWLGLTTEKILEDRWRTVKNNSVHRDIFTSIEKKIVEGIDGYKFFIEQAIGIVGMPGDFQILLNEYFQLDHSYLRLADQHELGRFATECTAKGVLNPCAAAFVIYYLSCIYDKAESMPFSNIQKCNAERLLVTLKDWPLQQAFGNHFCSRITETMFYLVRIYSSTSVWDLFVMWCYPSLSSSEILRLFEPSGYRPTVELVEKLCSCVGHCEGAEKILSAIISRETSLSALCRVIKTFSQSDVQEHQKCLDECRPYFVNRVKEQLDKLYMMQHLKELSEIAALIVSVDHTSVSEVLPTFEQKLLKILDRKEDVSHYVQYLEKVISYPVVFRDKQQAVKLFQIFAGSSQRSLHELLPRFLQFQQFSMLSDDESMLQLIDQWLSGVASVMPVSAVSLTRAREPKSFHDLHAYIFEVSKLPDDLLNTVDVKKEIQTRCTKTFCDLTLPSIKQKPNIMHLEVLEELFREMKDADSQLFEDFKPDIEDAITTIVQKESTCDTKQAQILVNLLLLDDLFTEANCSKEVLEYMADSRTQNIHQMFLKTMTAEKFWKIVSTADCEMIFVKWLAQAVKHSFDKAKKRRYGRADYYVLFLYDYLVDVLAVPSIKSNETIRNKVEITVKKELSEFEPKKVIDMLKSAAGEMKEDAMKLLELHLQGAEIKNLTSEREYHAALDQYALSEGKGLKAEQRYVWFT